MDFGIFNLMGFRQAGKSSREVVDETVEQTRLADEVGLGIAWFAEHHFSNYCICPSPLMMVANCAGVTKNIKLASGVLILPLYSPARLLSEIALTDALCHGRLVLGIGSGYQPYEFDRFGVDLADSKEMAREFIELMELAFANDFVDFKGKYYALAKTHISVRLANGLPPIWIGGDSTETYRLAARKGYMPIFSGRSESIEGLLKTRKRCEDAYRMEGIDPARMPIGLLRSVCVTNSKDEARRFAENARYQQRLGAALRNREEFMEGVMLVDRPHSGDPDIDTILDTLPIGDPETVAERLTAEIKALRPAHIAMYVYLGDTPQSVALNTIEAIATKVQPMIEAELGPLSKIGVDFAAPPPSAAPARLAAG